MSLYFFLHLFIAYIYFQCFNVIYNFKRPVFLCCVCVCVCVCVLSCSVMFDSLKLHELQLVRLLCPRNFLGKNIGVDCHFLLQGIIPTEGSNLYLLCLLHWKVDSVLYAIWEAPVLLVNIFNNHTDNHSFSRAFVKTKYYMDFQAFSLTTPFRKNVLQQHCREKNKV